MAKNVQSQWDFGDIAPEREILSVSQLTSRVRQLLERHIGKTWVSGEITNLRAQSSGHIYFTLKDANAQVSCVLFRGEPVPNREFLQDGARVILQGELTVYEPRGQYQLRVLALEIQGVGALQIAFERLKQKLKAEGLFATERKRPLPRFPHRIGLVTSPTGAAISDVLHVIERRNRSLQIIFVPCKVQGEGAAYEISGAIQALNKWSTFSPANTLDLILVTRGGGSLEDLWAFNEEMVARAIFHSTVPVVSAVGHEIDFTISDFVADFRAATPSAAAEVITEGVFSTYKFVSEVSNWFRQNVQQRLEREQRHLRQWKQRLARAHPRQRINEKLQRLDDLQTSLVRCAKRDWKKQYTAWRNLQERLSRVRPTALLRQRTELFAQLRERLHETVRHSLLEKQNRCAMFETRLRLLSPTQVLDRGYSITFDAQTGKVVRDVKQVSGGQRLKTKLAVGEIKSIVDNSQPGE
ncbi:MAG: Exodeoxyribonuclease 7 large subunit [Verrucomicrobiales bacterium]|nr:Exodeoxyribonuclease 7 large subunit [Verrucomicrobiales bacterium]